MARALILIVVITLATAAGVARLSGGQVQSVGGPRPKDQTEAVRLTYLGAAGWDLTFGQTVILVDPYLSRIPQSQQAARSPLEPNKEVIDAHVTRADFILVHHSHCDHMMDVPYIASRTGATIVGHESTANIASAFGIPRQKLITVRGGEDYQFATLRHR